MKPQLANDAVLERVKFPCGLLPKIDGVRALNITGTLTGRSLDPFKGYGITEYFSKPEFQFLDGEMVLGDNPASSDRLCSLTTGAMGALKGVTEMADLHWWVFDHLADLSKGYEDRWLTAKKYVETLAHPRIHIVPLRIVKSQDELKAAIAEYFEQGYEGAIIRNLTAPAKQGRPSKIVQEFVRIKPWQDSEMLVTGITEGNENTNEATVNRLGRTERSSAKDGMVPNGRVGSIQGILLEDCYSNITGKLLFKKGLPITISRGSMTGAEARDYFLHPEKIVDHIVKFQHMTHGVKDLPRMGGYISHRLREDMST